VRGNPVSRTHAPAWARTFPAAPRPTPTGRTPHLRRRASPSTPLRRSVGARKHQPLSYPRSRVGTHPCAAPRPTPTGRTPLLRRRASPSTHLRRSVGARKFCLSSPRSRVGTHPRAAPRPIPTGRTPLLRRRASPSTHLRRSVGARSLSIPFGIPAPLQYTLLSIRSSKRRPESLPPRKRTRL